MKLSVIEWKMGSQWSDGSSRILGRKLAVMISNGPEMGETGRV